MNPFDDEALQAGENGGAEYKFASGSIADFANELRKPKQEQDIDEVQDLQAFDAIEREQQQDDEPLEKIKARPSVAKASAKLGFMAIDALFATGIGFFIAKGEAADYKADPEEEEAIVDALTEYIKLKGGELPEWAALLIVISAVYGPKIAMAVKLRKANEKNAELEEQVKQLRAELEKQSA